MRRLLHRLLTSPSVFIGLFLAVQMVLPLHYYLLRDDRHDERFAWRMFSPERMVRCAPRFTVGEPGAERPIRLDQEFEKAWRELARRGRMVVVERMALALCDKYPDQPVRVDLRCQELGADEPVELTGGWDVCLTRSLR